MRKLFSFFLAAFLLHQFSVFAGGVRPLFNREPRLLFKASLKDIGDIKGVAALPEKGHFLFLTPSSFSEYRISETPEKIRTVKLEGFEKLSAIAYAGEGEARGSASIAFTEKSRAAMCLCEVPQNAETVRKDDCQVFPVTRLKFIHKKFGITAMAVEANNGNPVFYFGKEQMPKKFFHAAWSDLEWKPEEVWDAEGMLPADSIISDASLFNGSLFILDGKQGIIYQLDPLSGQSISSFSVRRDFKKKTTGVCLFDKDGAAQMLVASEKSVLVYSFAAAR